MIQKYSNYLHIKRLVCYYEKKKMCNESIQSVNAEVIQTGLQ